MFPSLRYRLIFGFSAIILLFASGVLMTLTIVWRLGDRTELLVDRYWKDNTLIAKTHDLLGEVAIHVSLASEQKFSEAMSHELQSKIDQLIREIDESSLHEDFRGDHGAKLRQLGASLTGPIELLKHLEEETRAADATLQLLLHSASVLNLADLAHYLNVSALAYRDFSITANPSDQEIFRQQLPRIKRELHPSMHQTFEIYWHHGEQVFTERLLLRQTRDDILSNVAEIAKQLRGRSEIYLQRVVYPAQSEVISGLSSISTILLAAVVASGLASLAVAILLARRFSVPMEQAVNVLSRIEGGDLQANFPSSDDAESDRLGRAINSLASSLRKALDDQEQTMQNLISSKTRFREIAEERQELERIINASPTIAFFVRLGDSGEEAMAFVSQSIRQLGYLPDNFLTGQQSLISIVHPDDVEHVSEILATHLKDRYSYGFSIDLRILDAQGAVRVMDVRILVQRNNLGNAIGYQGVMVDETDKEHLREQAERISNLASLGELAAGVAHEINNPNATILLNIAMLKDLGEGALRILDERFREQGDFMVGRFPYTRLREELPRLHSEVADAADRIRRIVDDMKTFTRLGPDHTRQLLNLNEIAESAIRLSHNALKNATDRFQTEFAHELLEVTVNRQQIEQVIVNLLINASQALTTRNEAIILRTGRDKPGKVWLAVIDEGRGISSENLSHVTDPFFTTRRERGGTGLGLSISARIVHDHHGELNITSLGRGTTVKIILPASDRKDQP